MKIRNRVIAVAAVPILALVATAALLATGLVPAAAALGVAAVGAVAGLGLAAVVAGTITEPLVRLGEAAERGSRLQTLVDALRRPGGNAQELALAPVGLPAGGEIGNLGHALDAFQGAAARLAVSQATLLNKAVADKGTIEVFVNLARRMQGLVDHQIEYLDALEAEEQDPDLLEELFRLDQLATRVRRNAESLLTLAGTTTSRSWERPLPMADVIRAGMAEVEDIARIDLLVDDNAAMVGNVAADAAHLLSELLENATRWSPPETRVQVTGTPAAGGYAITIEDAGIGMPGDALAEANHILTGPPLADTTVARSLGLVVAGRLARRLGIVVRLGTAATGGVVAKVLLPPDVMVAGADAEVAAGPSRALPFALARQEKRARITSQRSRGRRTADGPRGEATITQLPTSRWQDEAPPAPAPAPARVEVEPEPVWTEPAPAEAAEPQPWEDGWAPPAVEPSWPSTWDDTPAPETPAAAEPEWSPAEEPAAAAPVWEPAVPPPAVAAEPPAAEAEPPAAAAEPPAAEVVAEVVAEPPAAEVVAEPPAAAAEVVAEPEPAAAPEAEVPALPVMRVRPPAPPAEPPAAPLRPRTNGTEMPMRPVAAERRVPPPAPEPAPAAEAPASRPGPTVRPARFAAASSRPLAGDVAPAAPPVPDSKEEEYRRHLERATAAGLVRRVPKASLPQDTGGAAARVAKTAETPVPGDRLPDQVRSLLSSYRAGVQRGRVDEPGDDDPMTPQEQP